MKKDDIDMFAVVIMIISGIIFSFFNYRFIFMTIVGILILILEEEMIWKSIFKK